MNNVFNKAVQFVKVSAIASVLSLCALQGVRAETPVPGSRPPMPLNSTIVYADNNVIIFSNGLEVFSDGTEIDAAGNTYLPDGTIIPAS